MNYIVFDLEFTVLRQKQHQADILEIGAIKLKEDNGQLTMVDLFHTHVRPSYHPTIGIPTTQLTGITQEQVDCAPHFIDAVIAFREWLDDGHTPYYLCSWGPDDIHQLFRHCSRHNIDHAWVRNYNDFQLQFTRLQGGDIGQRLGLKKSLRAMELPFFGKQHNALDDAFNTAKLFSRVFPKLAMEQNEAPELSHYSTKQVYATDEAKHLPFANLAAMLGMVI